MERRPAQRHHVLQAARGGRVRGRRHRSVHPNWRKCHGLPRCRRRLLRRVVRGHWRRLDRRRQLPRTRGARMAALPAGLLPQFRRYLAACELANPDAPGLL